VKAILLCWFLQKSFADPTKCSAISNRGGGCLSEQWRPNDCLSASDSEPSKSAAPKLNGRTKMGNPAALGGIDVAVSALRSVKMIDLLS
jgi:hypothetical protein